MTRIPSDDPGALAPPGVAERVAGALRRHLLAAAQASLRTIREVLAQVPAPRRDDPVAPESAAPAPPVTGLHEKRERPMGHLPDPPAADLLRAHPPLPDSYGTERLVVLARDPHCLFAYWDLSDERRRGVRKQAGAEPLRLILRTYDVTQITFDARPPGRFQDFAVAAEARSVYAYVGKPAACFVAEVGYLRPDGVFFALARSQPVWTPRTEQPGGAPGRWMTVGWTERPAAGTLAPSEASGSGVAATMAPDGADITRRAASSWPGPLPLGAQRGSWSLVRGGLTTATPPDGPGTVRSEP